jgi:hypothetical protein
MHGHGTGGRMYKACVAGGVLRGTHRDRRGTTWASRCTCAPQKRGLRASEPEAQALCTSALQLQAHSGRGAGCTKHVWRAGCCGARTATGAGRPGRRGAPARRGWEGCERASRAQVALCIVPIERLTGSNTFGTVTELKCGSGFFASTETYTCNYTQLCELIQLSHERSPRR